MDRKMIAGDTAKATADAVGNMFKEILWTIKGQVGERFAFDSYGEIVDRKLREDTGKDDASEDDDMADGDDGGFDPVNAENFHMSVSEDAMKYATEIVPKLMGDDGTFDSRLVRMAGRLVGLRMTGTGEQIPDDFNGQAASMILAVPLMEAAWDVDENRPAFWPASDAEHRP